MSSPRLLLAAFVALATVVVPSTASAALKTTSPFVTPVGYGVDQNGQPRFTADGVLSPGEVGGIDFDIPLVEDASGDNAFTGGRGDLNRVNDVDANIANGSPGYRDYPASNGGGETQNPTPFHVNLGPDKNVGGVLQCGTNVGLRLDMTSTAGSVFTSYSVGLPTGAAGAYHRTASADVGNLIYDGQTDESVVDVSRGTDLAKGIRVHVDEIQHQYSTYWLEITLVSPSGKRARLFSQVGNLSTTNDPLNPPSRHLRNITFSETAVSGQAPIEAVDSVEHDLTGDVIRPKDSLSVFDGEPLTGKWKLEVRDISSPLDQRSNRRGRSAAPAGKVMIDLGDWQIDTAGAVCGAKPDAWFGGQDPLVIAPGGTATVDASASVATGLDGTINDPNPTPRTIASYKWDMNGITNDGPLGDGFEVTTSTPTSPAFTATKDTQVPIRLVVVDNDGNSSAPVSRTVIVTTKPTVDSITIDPVAPKAGDPVTVTAVGGTDAVGEVGPLTYSWDLNEDGVYGDSDDSTPPVTGGATITKIWPTSGPKVVRVKITDGAGGYTIKYQSLQISNTAPHAVITVLTNPAVVGQPTSFSGALSTDMDGTIASYSWDLDGNGTYDDASGPSPTVDWTFTEAQLAIVRLRVTDNTGEISDDNELASWSEVPVTGAPVPDFTASPASPLKGETVTFNAAASHDSDQSGQIVDYAWDLTGGNNFSAMHGPALVSVTKSFANAGNVVVKLQVTDNSGAKAVKSLTVSVRNPPVVTPPGGGGGTPTPTTPGTSTPGTKEINGTTWPSTPTTGTNPKDVKGDVFLTDTPPPSLGSTVDGFSAKLIAGSKQKAKKAAKSGVLLTIVTSDPGKIAIKAVVTKSAAKTVGLKLKGNTAIGAGQVQITKGVTGKYTAKFYVKFKAKYAKNIKKSKKLKISMVAVVSPKAGGDKLTISRPVVIIKG